MKTLGEIITESVVKLERQPLAYGHGMENAIDEAVYLALYAAGLPFDLSESEFDRVLSSDDEIKIGRLIDKRIQERKPAAYLTHEAWFAGHRFFVNENVLVPRSPFAELINAQFRPWLTSSSIENILEIGTGSGCIAIACAHAFKSAKVDALDISAEALSVARKNIETHQLMNRVFPILSDLFSAVPNKRYDLIVSNPPYVDVRTVDDLPDEYQHEPRLGLESGSDGFECVDRLLCQSKNYLKPGGLLFVEVGYQKEALEARYPNLPLTWVEFEFGGDGLFVLEANHLTAENLKR